MERNFIQDLLEWKSSKNRKPLILWGARQVGKTWIMKEFGNKFFENTLYISFYNNQKDALVFESDYDVKRILSVLEIHYHTKINPQNTLIIFDEVQSAPKVVESLKYFCEDAPEYAIIAAGSLLGVSIHEGISFPVGKVNELYLHPMTFDEYLKAIGESSLVKLLEESEMSDPIFNDLGSSYIQHLKDYFFVGGMPEVVKTFVQTKDYDAVRYVQNEIIHQYEGDFGKHISANELARIRLVWHSLPMQLAKENKKFFFGQIKQGARMKDFEVAIQWLCDSGLIHKVNKVEKPAVPLKSYISFSDFKLYMLDIGLLGALSELDKESILDESEIFVEFKGAMTEQYVLQELVAKGNLKPYYFSGEKSTYEVDFVLQKNSNVIPLEVKAAENVKAKSLRFYYEKFNPVKAYRTSLSNYREQDWIINFPLWAVSKI